MADEVPNAPGSDDQDADVKTKPSSGRSAPFKPLPGESSDPFQRLHKMSTTAGLGSGDYVAISGTAIIAILLGVASSIVLFDSWLLLTIPLLGVACAVLAFVQIKNSNGTQTGNAVAGIGLLLSLGFGGFYSAKTVVALIHSRADDRQLVGIIQRFGQLIKTKDYAAAYPLLDDRLKSKVPPPVFDATLAHVTTSPVLGTIEGMDWNNLISYGIDPVTGDRIANGYVKLGFTNSPEAVRMPMSFRNLDGKWYIDQMPSFFSEDAPPAPTPKVKPMGPPVPR